jgi:YHS domain-containing protein
VVVLPASIGRLSRLAARHAPGFSGLPRRSYPPTIDDSVSPDAVASAVPDVRGALPAVLAGRDLWLEDGALRDRKAEQHAWVTDPVCGMRIDAWTPVLASDYEGRRYSFCSTRCQARFTDDPAVYASGHRGGVAPDAPGHP